MRTYWAYTMTAERDVELTACNSRDHANWVSSQAKALGYKRVGASLRKASEREAVAYVAGVCGVPAHAVQVVSLSY